MKNDVCSPCTKLAAALAGCCLCGGGRFVARENYQPSAAEQVCGWQFQSVIFGFLIGINFGYGGAGAGVLGGRIVVTLLNRILQQLFLGCFVTVVALLLLG